MGDMWSNRGDDHELFREGSASQAKGYHSVASEL